MKMYIKFLKTKQINEYSAFYKITSFESKEYVFYISVNLTTKVIMFFKQEGDIKSFGQYNFNYPDNIIKIPSIPNETAIRVCGIVYKSVKNNSLPETMNHYIG